MTFKMPSNRRIHPQNGKVVNTAIDMLKTTAPISQEKYWNAFRVNGYTCSVYSFLEQGRICSCTEGTNRNIQKPILDEDGNAPLEFIDQMLNGGLINGAYNYGEEIVSQRPATVINQFDTKKTHTVVSHTNTDLSTPNEDYIEEDYSGDFLESEISMTSTNKCGICFGSGYVGGFNLWFGNRLVIDCNYTEIKYHGYSTHQENTPYSFIRYLDTGYIDFTVTLPCLIASVIAFNLKMNAESITGAIDASIDGTTFTKVNKDNITDFCLGVPITLRVSDIESFTHLEIEFSLNEQPTYLEYPVINETGDVSMLDAVGDVQVYVSPLIPSVKPKDIIVDNTLGKIWRVITVNDHKDRNYNMHGWETTARLVQRFEIYNILPRAKTIQKQLTTKLNRW